MSTSSLIELLSTCFAFSGKNPRMPNGRILLWPMWDAKANTSRFHCSDIVWALPSAISTINTGSPRGANCCCQPHGRHGCCRGVAGEPRQPPATRRLANLHALALRYPLKPSLGAPSVVHFCEPPCKQRVAILPKQHLKQNRLFVSYVRPSYPLSVPLRKSFFGRPLISCRFALRLCDFSSHKQITTTSKAICD